MADFLSLYGHNIGSTSGGGGTGGGHEIVNASGTSLPQEDKLQFTGGLKATDDSTNGKTIVDDSADTYTWVQWTALTPEQQAAIPKAVITGAPGLEGEIQANLLTKLWENSDPTASFTAQNVTLSSDNYDFLLIIAEYSSGGSSGNNDCIPSIVIPKGRGGFLSYGVSGTIRGRRITYVSDTVLSIAEGFSGGTSSSDVCVPIAVYGIKKTISLDSAIATNISTSANKCILNDNITSVQSEITRQNINTFGTGIPIAAATDYTAPSDGYVRFAGSTTQTILLNVNNQPLIQSTPEASTGASRLYSLYVRKGMVIKMTNGTATFYPFE